MEFPAFRTAEWINSTYNFNTKKEESPNNNYRFWVPLPVLHGVEFLPQKMEERTYGYMYKVRRKEVHEEIRRALFRQALFKVGVWRCRWLPV